MADTIGTYGVSDNRAVRVVSVVGQRDGVVDLFQLVVSPDSGSLTVIGVIPPLRNIDPPPGTLSLSGAAPTVVNSGYTP